MSDQSGPSAEEIADVLDGAADVLLRDGWCGNGWTDERGRRCVLHAIHNTAGDRPLLYAYAAKSLYVARGWISNVGDWNDHPHTTEDDVHDLLRSTAKRLREEAQTDA